MRSRVLNAWIRLLGLSLFLLSNQVLSQECGPEASVPSVGNFKDLAESVASVRDRIYLSQATKKLSSAQIDRLAAEASDLVYSLFKQVNNTGASRPRYFVEEAIMPAARGDSWQEAQSSPAGYRVAASWNDNHRNGVSEGVFGALYEPQNSGDPVIFAFKGTSSGVDLKEDLLHQGGAQLRSFFRMINVPRSPGETVYLSLLKRLESGQDVLITGHSLGGGLAQAAAYLLQRDLEELRRREIAQGKNPKLGNLHLVTFNALGGQQTLKQFSQLFSAEDRKTRPFLYQGTRLASERIDPRVDEMTVLSMRARNYACKGDPVSPLFDHIGPKFVLVPKRTDSDAKNAVARASGMIANAVPGIGTATMLASLTVQKTTDIFADHSIKVIRQAIDPDFKP